MIEKFIMAGDQPLHICDSQRGEECIVLLHGYMEAMSVWESFVPYLYKELRVITLDIPGHGISVVNGEEHSMEFLATVVHNAITALGVERYSVVGHSMGGYVALAMCSLFAESIESVVLFSSTPNADTPEKQANRLREISLIKSGKKELLANSLPAAGFASANRTRMKDYIADLREQIYITEEEGIIALLAGMMNRPDQNEMLRNLERPQLFIMGKEDEYIPYEVAQNIVASHPRAEVVWLERSGHMGFLEEPAASAEAIVNFIKKI